ncbi:hypothetical protein B0H63DRAFT_528852 [Podospora didyma]|uniref:Transcription factor hoxa13 n=1 Tax=Podospora didyma TaxID=330526 RepID=A0AAE0N2H4_9PEZI|nr:hypothetical protein B0H63DRAFT_528852 [Podospora didyma]
MDDSNGSLKGTKGTKSAKPMNGINGAIKLPLNGHPVGPRRTTAPVATGLLARSLGVVARLLTWYSIIIILFRCPSNLGACDETSPAICKPYFQLKQAVVPHVEPYYDAYAAPYIDLVRPYYNTIDQKVISPSLGYAKKFGAPRIQLAQAYSQAQWQKNVQPQLAKYQHLAKAKYDQNLAPHVDRVSAAAGPYYDIARTNALQTYHELLLPTYNYVQPYAHLGYLAASDFTIRTAVPSALWAWNKTYVFLDATVWPHLRVAYMENVEPQLIKIGKRLGRYSSGKKSVPKSPVVGDSSTRWVPADSARQGAPSLTKPSSSTKTTSSFVKPVASVSSTTTSSSLSSVSPSSSLAVKAEGESSAAAESIKPRSTSGIVPPPEVEPIPENEDPERRSVRETVTADLKDWQERYAKAADEGAAEIDQRVEEITKKMIRRNARVKGKDLLQQLQTTIVAGLVQLRRDILEIVGTVSKGTATQEEAEENIVKAVRYSGLAIKEKAQAVRTWREEYEQEMQTSITKAAETHFSILGSIRDLALQKIGMKWAWMDGVTYKDWAKYHVLKGRFDEWQGDLENLIVTHPSLEAAQNEAAQIEEDAMKLAASAAKELARLKQVAKWKLVAVDDTPEFDSTLMQQAADAAEALKAAAASVIGKAVDSINDLKDTIIEKAGEGADYAADAFSDATDALKGAKDTTADGVEDLVESASEVSQSLTSAASVVEETLSSVSTEASAAIIETALPSVESATTEEPGSVKEAIPKASETIEQAIPDLASTIILEETPVIAGNTSELLQEDGPAPVELPLDDPTPEEEIIASSEEAPTQATPSIKSAFLGAAAQSVPSRKPILDDEEDDVSGAMESLQQELKSAYAAASSRASDQYSQALSIVSAQIHGTPEPAHQQMIASVTSAYSKAMASASSRLDDALRAASVQLKGTPTKRGIFPTTVALPTVPTVDWARFEAIESVAGERLRQGLSWAEEQYESAKVAVGLATPTPSRPADYASKLLENARHNYYAAIGVAHARHSEFMAAASSALSSLTATPTPTDLAGTASSVASVASASAASAGSVVTEGAASAASVASKNVSSAASVVGENVSSVAAAGYDSAASAASVVGESAASAASVVADGASSAASVVGDNVSAAAAAGYDSAAAAADKVSEGWEVVVSKISIQVYGAPTPTPWYASIYSAAGGYAASATDAAGDGAASVTDAAGSYAAAASEEAAKRYAAVSLVVSELLIGKEPTFSESVFSRLSAAYETGLASASSLASAAQATAASAAGDASEAIYSVGDKVASAASSATDAVKHGKDEL